MNIRNEIEQGMPPELLQFLKEARTAAHSQGQHLYIVGGVVRDLLLKKPVLDLDLAVEGDAVALAKSLVQGKPVKLTTHARFNTATLRWDKWSVDIATARSESYARPGALPRVTPDTIEKDLFRRDFTVNAMAVRLDPDSYGDVIDLYGGLADLKKKVIRILHQDSFVDDATRIWRAVRYEQRLGFSMEPVTLASLKANIPMLDTVSGDRIRNELLLVLREEYPEKALARASELGLLKKIHPALNADAWLAGKLDKARYLYASDRPPVALNMALLVCRMDEEGMEDLISYLRLSRPISEVMKETRVILNQERELADTAVFPSRIYNILHGRAPMAVATASLAVDSETAGANIKRYSDTLRHMKPALTGKDLVKLGIPAGPQLKEILRELLYARLDGTVTRREQEEAMVKGIIKTH